MAMKKFASGLAALGLVAAPAIAQISAGPATAPLSETTERYERLSVKGPADDNALPYRSLLCDGIALRSRRLTIV